MKNEPPVVEEGAEAIRKRRGTKKNKVFARNFTLKPMRSIAPLLRCDPARLERIRQKEKDNKYKASTDLNNDGETQVQVDRNNCTNNVPIMPSTVSSSHEPSTSTSSEFRANEGDSTRQRIQRSDFSKHIQQDIEAQASNAAEKKKDLGEEAKPSMP